MRLLICILIPWLGFFTIGRPFAGIICLILQICVMGWPIAAIWSVYSLSKYENEKRLEEILLRRKYF